VHGLGLRGKSNGEAQAGGQCFDQTTVSLLTVAHCLSLIIFGSFNGVDTTIFTL
jgi:hypothetical protein